MLEEFYPEDFSWADPSKLRTAQVFQLLDHWRQHEQDGMAPIKWNPLCRVFAPMTIRAQRCQKPSSSSEPDAPLEEHEASSCPPPKQAYSKHQSGEEDFDEDLQRILDDDSEDDSEYHHSYIPSPSPVPRPRVQRVSKPCK